MIRITKKYFSKLNIPENLLHYFRLAQNKTSIEKLIPKSFEKPNDFINHFKKSDEFYNFDISENLTKSYHNSIGIPIWDMIDRGGKRWRIVLSLMIGKLLNYEIDNYEKSRFIYDASALVEIMHNASLIIDDITDKSEFRREKKCVHLIYGNITYNI